jgi:hypothetical protein
LIRNELDWQPQICMTEGICESIAYYRRELDHYLERQSAEPSCAVEGRR